MQVNIQLNNKQLLAMRYLMDTTTEDIGYGGAAGGGKTYLGVIRLWTLCNQYPGTRRCIARNELKKLRQSTFPSYMKFCSDYQIPQSQVGKMNFQDNTIKFTNGSEILFLDLAYRPSDPMYQWLGSYELTGGWIEESAEVHPDGVEVLRTRIGRWKNVEYNLLGKVLQTFNPDKGHVYTSFYKPLKDGTLPPNKIFIPALVTDNPKISKQYIETLKNLKNKVMRERLLHGNFDYDDTPGRLFTYDAILDIATNPSYHDGKKYITCDPSGHGKDLTVIRVREGRECIKTVIMHDTDQRALRMKIQELANQYGVPMRRVCVDANGIGAGVTDELRCVGFVSQSKPIKRNKDDITPYATLRDQCCFYLADIVADAKIRIEDMEEKLIQEFDVLVQVDMDKDRPQRVISKEKIKEKIGRSTDHFDTVMMRSIFDLGIAGDVGVSF